MYLLFVVYCVVQCVAKLGAILPPRIVSVARSNVKLSYSPPTGASSSEVVVYIIKYRKVGSGSWKSTMESVGLWQTVTGLEANSQYEFRVVARYRGASSTVESSTVTPKTTDSKYSYWSFPPLLVKSSKSSYL